MEFRVEASVAEEASALLAELRARPPYAILGDTTTVFASLEQVEAQLADWQQRLAQLAVATPALPIIPLLLQAATKAYCGTPDERCARVGPALKVAVANVWPSVWNDIEGPAPASPRELVETAFVVEQLDVCRAAFLHARSGRVEMTAGSATADGPVGDLLEAFAVAFQSPGQCLRLADETSDTILADADRVLYGILRVLRGDAAPIKELSECWLSQLPRTEPRAFWQQLATRLTLYVLVRSAIAGRNAAPESIVTFRDFAVALPRRFQNIRYSPDARTLFWQRDWLAKQHPRAYRNALVERPIMRVGRDPIAYCTSLTILADAVNWFVESSLIRHHGASGVALSNACFRRLLSKPFERSVEAVMRDLGFRAGTVTRKGSWRTGASIDLAAIAGPPPGEIDVLATRDDGAVLVLECKVLAMPDSDARMRNLLGKLGDDDTEAIHAKVRAKRQWVHRVAPHLAPSFQREVGIIVLDRPWPGIRVDGDVWVVDVDRLAAAVSQLISTT